MIKNVCINKIKCIYFVGIGGISMSGLAKYCKQSGLIVSGSDKIKSETTRKLEEEGIKVYYSQDGGNILGNDAVVYTSAISLNNDEIKNAKKYGIPLIKRSELLASIISECQNSIAVSGSHGKTTTTSMIADLFIEANKNPLVFVGGESEFGNYRYGKDNAIFEACEYKKNFLDIKAKLYVVLNIDNDHLDSYNGIQDEINCFKKFINDGVSLVNVDDSNSKSIIGNSSYTFGIENKAEFMAKRIACEEGVYSFDLYAYNKKYGRVKLNIYGKHNVYNALATFAVGIINKISFNVIKNAIENFHGVKRRYEKIGSYKGIDCICDYAHHPREIMATIQSMIDSKNIIIVFQPHTYSRTRFLLKDFIKSLSVKPTVIIYKTYPAREKFDKYGSAKTLYSMLIEKKKNCFYSENIDQLKRTIDDEKDGKKYILFLGAGDIYEIAKTIVKEQN